MSSPCVDNPSACSRHNDDGSNGGDGGLCRRHHGLSESRLLI